MNTKIVGIVAGKGALPKKLVCSLKSQNIRFSVAALTEEQRFDKSYSKHFKLGEVGGIIKYFRQANVTDIVLVGGINRPSLGSLKVDTVGAKLLAKLVATKFKGDDAAIKLINKFIEDQGFRVSAINEFLPKLTVEPGVITKNAPKNSDQIDIELGLKVAKVLGKLDIGQSVIVENGYVLGVEAAEGTDSLIIRCAQLRKEASGGVLIKTKKPEQDSRVDMPTIGPETIKNLAISNFSGLAIETGSCLVVDLETTTKLANELGIFIKVL